MRPARSISAPYEPRRLFKPQAGTGLRWELLTFAFLAALGGCDAQVKGHVAANINVGNTRQALLGVLTVLVPFIGYPRTLNATWRRNGAMTLGQCGRTNKEP